jgi:hypothetical protein
MIAAHPSNRNKLEYYFITHNPLLNISLLMVSVVYMALALVEGPGQPVFEWPQSARIAIETFCLSVFGAELIVRQQWRPELHTTYTHTIEIARDSRAIHRNGGVLFDGYTAWRIRAHVPTIIPGR